MNSLISKLFILLTTTAFFISCETETNTTEDHEKVQENWRQFVTSWNNLDSEGCKTVFAEDAILIPSQLSQLEGSEAISAFYENLFSMNQSAKYTHTTESLSFSGDLAIELANFSVNWISNEGESWTYDARAMIQWESNEIGDWKIKKLLFNLPPTQPTES